MSADVQPMLSLVGKVMHTFLSPDSVDHKTGEVRKGKHKVQLLCHVVLQNGQERIELQTLSTDAPALFEPLAGRLIRVPVGVYALGKSIGFYVLKGARPEVLE